MNLSLYKQMLRTNMKGIMSYGVGSAFYILLILGIYPSIAGNAEDIEKMIKSMPEGFLNAFGFENGLGNLEDFISGEYYGLIFIVILSIFSVMLSTKLLAKRVDQGSMAYILSAPTTRGKVSLYVQRAQALGAGHLHILLRHILPQVIPLIGTTGALAVALAILTQAALEFFGLAGTGVLSWGTMIRFAFQRDAMLNDAWWFVVPPGLCICIVITACYWLAQSLEKALNPRLSTTDLRVRAFSLRSAREGA